MAVDHSSPRKELELAMDLSFSKFLLVLCLLEPSCGFSAHGSLRPAHSTLEENEVQEVGKE